MLVIAKAITVLAYFLLLFLFLLACLIDWVEANGGLMVDHVIWKVLPVIVLINLMYLASRLVVRIERPSDRHEHREG